MTPRLGLALLGLVAAVPAAAQRPPRPPTMAEREARLAADSLDPMAHYEAGMAYFDADRWDAADRAFRRAIALAPQYADAYLALSLIPEARGEKYWKKRVKDEGATVLEEALREAHRFYRRAFLLNPLVDIRLYARARERQTRMGPLVIVWWWQGGYRKAIGHVAKGDFDRASTELTKLFHDVRAGGDGERLPFDVVWLRGLVAAQLKDYPAAAADFARLTGRAFAAEQEPGGGSPFATNDYRYALATMRHFSGQYGEALATYRRTLEFDVGLYQSHIQIARIFEARSMWDSAIVARRSAIDANPDDGSLVTDLGATLALSGRESEAEAVLADAVARAPLDPRAAYLLGLMALRRDHADVARRSFERFLAIAPSRYAAQVAEVRQHLAALP